MHRPRGRGHRGPRRAEGTYLGCILLADAPKANSKAAIEAVEALGAHTVMLTGDSEKAAALAAKTLGISEYRAGLLPGGKVEALEELLKSTDGKVAFVGDGVNDAPVLARADVGIAMGALGSDAAIEAADVVIMDDDPAKLPLAIRLSRRCMRIVRSNIAFAIGVKFAFLVLGALGIVGMSLAIFADVGVMVLAVLNSMRTLRVKHL
ncbi:MAG: HAD-IC family P-type ATPase [Oscillospiraceae bacterium]